jgi:hypothetical protein
MWRGTCFGLVLVCGHPVTGAAVPQEIHVRLIDIETGKPVKGEKVELTAGKGKEVASKPIPPRGVIPMSTVPESRVVMPTSIDGVARFHVPAPVSRDISEVSLIRLQAPVYGQSGESLRYFSCSYENWFRTEEVLRYGVVARKTMGCLITKALVEVEATPGEIVIFVHHITWWERVKHWFSDS